MKRIWKRLLAAVAAVTLVLSGMLPAAAEGKTVIGGEIIPGPAVTYTETDRNEDLRDPHGRPMPRTISSVEAFTVTPVEVTDSSLCVLNAYVPDIYYGYTEEEIAKVKEKVDEVWAECEKNSFTTDYEKAVWLHDWLIKKVNYDYTYSRHEAKDVLLEDTGVCDAYSKAYKLLLDAAGITENVLLYTWEMDPGHAWNLVKLDGKWCHVDCTWDDPGEGGYENHDYFGLTDAMMRRDHAWVEADYAAYVCDSPKNVYVIREEKNTFSDTTELDKLLAKLSENPLPKDETQTVEIYYTGIDPNFSTYDALMDWYIANDWKYGLGLYGLGANPYKCTYLMKYQSPWKDPSTLEKIADAGFTLHSPEKTYTSIEYLHKKPVVILFTASTLPDSIRSLYEVWPALHTAGVEVIVNVTNCHSAEELQKTGFLEDFPGLPITYASKVTTQNCIFSNELWQHLSLVGYKEGTVNLPVTFVYDTKGNIAHYTLSPIWDYQKVLENNGIADIQGSFLTSGRLGDTISWFVQKDLRLALYGLTPGQKVCAAIYDQGGKMLKNHVITTDTDPVTFSALGNRCKLFLLNDHWIPQAEPSGGTYRTAG